MMPWCTADRLKIGKCNLRLSSDVTSKEATLQVVYDVLKITPFYKAFQVTADAPEIYMQEFWASAYDILQICPKVGNKKFVDPPLETEILIFLASLGHFGDIRKLTDRNSTYDSLRLSQAQILWGMYNKKNVDYAYLLWEVLQFSRLRTKVRRRAVRCTILGSPRMKPLSCTSYLASGNLTNEDIRNQNPTKRLLWASEQFPLLSKKGSKKKANTDAIPKQKPPTAPKEKKSGKGKQKSAELETIFEADLTEAEQLKIVTKRSCQETHSSHASVLEQMKGNWYYTRGFPMLRLCSSRMISPWKTSEMIKKMMSKELKMKKMQNKFDGAKMQERLQMTGGSWNEEVKDTNASSSVSSGFVSSMLNPNQDIGVDDIFRQNTEATSLIDTNVTAISWRPFFTEQIKSPQQPHPIIIQPQQLPILTPATTTSSSLQNLPNFASLFGFDHRLKALEDTFSELRQTNQYAEALSSIPSTVEQYLANKMQEAVDVAVQLKYERIREESSTANQQFLESIDDGMKKIIKEQVKKEVSKIIPTSKKLVNRINSMF
ncbi:hypothetical protein Tco_1378121 [Tanacetum coccineum]